MGKDWTFGQRLAASFAVIVLLAVASTIISIYALHRVVREKDHVIEVNAAAMIQASNVEAATFRESAAARGYMLSGDAVFAERVNQSRGQFQRALDNLRRLVETDSGRKYIADIAATETAFEKHVDNMVAMRNSGATTQAMARYMTKEAQPTRNQLEALLTGFETLEGARLNEGRAAATQVADSARNGLIALSVVIVLGTILLAWLLARGLTQQISSAVTDIQTSSTQLQSTSTDQATGAREQATAMTEITTTINELLATSRQIAESAQRVAAISADAANSATAGDRVVRRAHESVDSIRRQVEAIVNHMLDLGRKSQQIGSVVEIITELAEQTNILAINANIEAAGAGEAGRRFAVVADEIRKLADRVSGSTKDIRALVDEVRAAVNTTVMATETASKAVEGGTRQFGEVTEALHQITGLVATTTEAAREIELSTKQQSTAVEQVNAAVGNVAQVSREAEASTAQAMQTATELAALSRGLARLIRAGAAA